MTTATAARVSDILVKRKEKHLKELGFKRTEEQSELVHLGRLKPGEVLRLRGPILESIGTIERTIEQEEQCRKALKNLCNNPTGKVTVNSIVDLDNEVLIIVAKPRGCCACSILLDDGRNAICVSPEAPFVKELLDKQKGDTVSFRGETYKIIDIQ